MTVRKQRYTELGWQLSNFDQYAVPENDPAQK